MNRDEIKAEWDSFIEYPGDEKTFVTTTSALLFAEHIASMTAKAEREACARMCDELEQIGINDTRNPCGTCADAIRARSQQ
jgi:hypothetical protein